MNKETTWGGKLNIFRNKLRLSTDELARELSILGAALEKKERSNDREALLSIGAETYSPLDGAAIWRLEQGERNIPKRERILFHIYYFRTKHIIDLKSANDWLSLTNWRSINEDECLALFGHRSGEYGVKKEENALAAGEDSKLDGNTLQLPVSFSSPLAFAPEAPDETLIVIATFHGSAAKDDESHVLIRRGIEQKLQTLQESNVRVVLDPTVLTADHRTEAEDLGKQYNASIVIWGEHTRIQVTVNFLYLRHPDFEVAATSINETLPNQYSAISAPEAYTQFITDDLPRRLTFLSLFAIAHRYYITQDYSRATILIEEAIASLSNKTNLGGLAEAYYRMGWLYHEQAVHSKDSADYNKVIEIYNRTIELKSNYASAYNSRGVAYDEQGMYIEALADYEKAIQLDPKLALAYNSRGASYHKQGMYIEALADYEKAIQLDPKLAFAYNNRGLVYYEQGMHIEALTNYEKAIQLDPNYRTALKNRDFVYREQETFKGLPLKEAFYMEKLEFVKVGIIAFFRSSEVEDIRELAVKTALLNTIPDIIEFTSLDERVDPDSLSNDIIEPAKYAYRKSEINDNFLSSDEIALANRRRAACVILAIGANPNNEKCFVFFTISVAKINKLVRMIQESSISRSGVNSVVHYGLGVPGKKDIDKMFDNWLYTESKTAVKYCKIDP